MLVQIGNSGLTVKDIQESLNVALPSDPLLVVDGMFGPKTRQRVVDFQALSGLDTDGVVGPKTTKILVGVVLTKLRGFS